MLQRLTYMTEMTAHTPARMWPGTSRLQRFVFKSSRLRPLTRNLFANRILQLASRVGVSVTTVAGTEVAGCQAEVHWTAQEVLQSIPHDGGPLPKRRLHFTVRSRGFAQPSRLQGTTQLRRGTWSPARNCKLLKAMEMVSALPLCRPTALG